MEGEPAAHLQQERDAMVDYSLASSDVDALDRLLSILAERKIAAIVVNLPVSAKFIGLVDGGQTSQDEFTDRVRSVSEKHSALWVDSMVEPWDDEWFADVNHLNDRGAARLEPILKAALTRVQGR